MSYRYSKQTSKAIQTVTQATSGLMRESIEFTPLMKSTSQKPHENQTTTGRNASHSPMRRVLILSFGIIVLICVFSIWTMKLDLKMISRSNESSTTTAKEIANQNISHSTEPSMKKNNSNSNNKKPAAAASTNIKTAISNHIEIHAYYTTDKTTIKPLIKSCFLRYDCADCDSKMPLRNLKALETTLDSCATQHRNAKAITVNLFLNFSHWYVDTSKVLDVCNFEIFDHNAFPHAPPVPAPALAPATTPPGLCPGVLALILQVDRNVRLYFEALAPA